MVDLVTMDNVVFNKWPWLILQRLIHDRNAAERGANTAATLTIKALILFKNAYKLKIIDKELY